jgi:hypothetical protein
MVYYVAAYLIADANNTCSLLPGLRLDAGLSGFPVLSHTVWYLL